MSGGWFWVLRKVRADVFPANLVLGVYLDQASTRRFAKEGVSIRQSLSRAHEWRVEGFLEVSHMSMSIGQLTFGRADHSQTIFFVSRSISIPLENWNDSPCLNAPLSNT
jgi:hypothetical protein